MSNRTSVQSGLLWIEGSLAGQCRQCVERTLAHPAILHPGLPI